MSVWLAQERSVLDQSCNSKRLPCFTGARTLPFPESPCTRPSAVLATMSTGTITVLQPFAPGSAQATLSDTEVATESVVTLPSVQAPDKVICPKVEETAAATS